MELLNKPYSDLFTILTSYPELENYLSPFMDAWKGGAQDQLQGQIASAKIPLTRMISPQLYWVMTGNDFSLDINNPKEPKILCVGNNPDRQNIYSAALGLYNSRIVKLINKKGQLKSTVIIDELPTIYFRGLDNLIATARSNKVAVCLGFQDFSQLNRDYGEKESKVIQNTVGNIFSGQVVGETAKTLSERFGKILQKRQSISINRQDVSTSINTQLDSLIPASKISNLSQGTFVGSVSDNFGEKINQKIFHAEIIVDHAKVSAEEKAYKKIPVINRFKDSEGNDIMLQQIQRNYDQIKADAQAIINDEMERIKSDPELCERLGIESAEEDEKNYLKDKGMFFGLMFSDNLILIKVIESVEEMEAEGKAMHHCVGGYHRRKDSLILSATIDGKRIETIEVSLTTLKVVQSRGACNSNTEYHDRIIRLVEDNAGLIQQRMNAA